MPIAIGVGPISDDAQHCELVQAMFIADSLIVQEVFLTLDELRLNAEDATLRAPQEVGRHHCYLFSKLRLSQQELIMGTASDPWSRMYAIHPRLR